MIALVTGPDGLLGSHLVRSLLDRSWSVRVLTQPGSSSPTLGDLPVDRVEGDLLDEGTSLENAVKGCDHVFHCAAITDLRADPELTWRVNLDGTRRILDACASQKVRRLVHTGSASSFQFGSMESPGDETAPFPQAHRGIAYMESKYQAMKEVQARVKDGTLDAVIVAPTFLLGSYDWRPSSGELIRQFIRRGLRFTSPGGRNFAHAADVAMALVSACEKGESGECYLAGGENLSYLQFFSRVASIAGSVEPPRLVLPAPIIRAAGFAGSVYSGIFRRPALLDNQMSRLSLYGTYYSSAKAVRVLGMPQTSIDGAIEASIQSLREYGHIP